MLTTELKNHGGIDPAPDPVSYMRGRRPSEYSDSEATSSLELTQGFLEYHLETLTSRSQETEFAYFARRLAEKEICPNLRPQTGPTGGGDGKADSETIPVSGQLAELWAGSVANFWTRLKGAYKRDRFCTYLFTTVLRDRETAWSFMGFLETILSAKMRGLPLHGRCGHYSLHMRYRYRFASQFLVNSRSIDPLGRGQLAVAGVPDELSAVSWRTELVMARLGCAISNASRTTLRAMFAEFSAFRQRVYSTAESISDDEKIARATEFDYSVEMILCGEDPWESLDAHLACVACLWLDDPVSFQHAFSFGVEVGQRRQFLARHYAIASLRYVELALLARRAERVDQALRYALLAASTSNQAMDLVFDGEEAILSEIGRRGAKARHRIDPKQKAKAAVYDLWRRWQNGQENFPNNAKFALAAVQQHADLGSTQVVERWQRNWRKGKDIPGSD
ncbi:hypothetical protein PQQ96_24215 [Paraburkholderia sediminicola]|uniref:hypothetical protein n=1 Tax=Paraburkholderia sediminicola TaxID=458836 RepID=UPI0038B706A2